jgi:hypothetical protein
MRRVHPLAAIAAVLFVLFAAGVGLRLHGFSLAAWHRVIDGSPPSEVLIGQARPIRSDDWKVHLPLIFAQAAHDPPFPLVDRLVGLGQSALVPLPLPVAHPLSALRPTLWGFFLGNDVGLAWMWWSRVLGLFGIWLGVFWVVGRGRLALAAAASALLVFSPFFQFWAFNAAPHAASMGLAFLATVGLARARGRASIAAWAALLAWSGGWFALGLYPPYEVVLGLLYLALVLAFWLERRGELDLRARIALRGVALALAAAVVLGVLLAYVYEAGDAIRIARDTVYPGARIEQGGERTTWQLLNANLGAGFVVEDWGPLYNICEAASFWLVAPVLAAAWLWRRRRGEPIDPFALPILTYSAALWVYVLVGLPEWLARVTPLRLVPASRAVLGIGLADAILLVRFLARSRPLGAGERRPAAALAVGFGIALAACGVFLHRTLPDAPLPWLLGWAAANGALAWWLLAGRRPALSVLAMAAAAAATTAWFNPVALGGWHYLEDNELSRRILAIDREAGGGTTWITFGDDELADLFRMLGVRALNGTHPLPQFELWAELDPTGRARSIYNRYAHVAFVADRGPSPRFALRSRDAVVVRIDPRSAAFRALGATHALLHGPQPDRFARSTGLELLGSVGENHLYRVPPPADAPP